MSATARLALPLLAAGQAQKELFHNEALQALDTLVASAVEEGPRNSPPASPGSGDCYIVGAAPTGAWAGKQQSLAAYTAGGWRFLEPRDGLNVFVRSTAVWALYRSGAWEWGTLRGSSVVVQGQQVVGPRGAAIAGPGGGTTVDAEARSAIGQILTALRLHGLIET